MRFTFPNGEHPGVELTRGSLSIGSGSEDTVCLGDAGLKPSHARIDLQPERQELTESGRPPLLMFQLLFILYRSLPPSTF